MPAMGKGTPGKGKYVGKNKSVGPSRGRGKSGSRREDARPTYPDDERDHAEVLKARLISKQRGGDEAKRSSERSDREEPELDDKASTLRNILMLKKGKLKQDGNKEATAKFASAGAAARGAAALATGSSGAGASARKAEVEGSASPSSPVSLNVTEEEKKALRSQRFRTLPGGKVDAQGSAKNSQEADSGDDVIITSDDGVPRKAEIGKGVASTATSVATTPTLKAEVVSVQEPKEAPETVGKAGALDAKAAVPVEETPSVETGSETKAAEQIQVTARTDTQPEVKAAAAPAAAAPPVELAAVSKVNEVGNATPATAIATELPKAMLAPAATATAPAAATPAAKPTAADPKAAGPATEQPKAAAPAATATAPAAATPAAKPAAADPKAAGPATEQPKAAAPAATATAPAKAAADPAAKPGTDAKAMDSSPIRPARGPGVPGAPLKPAPRSTRPVIGVPAPRLPMPATGQGQVSSTPPVSTTSAAAKPAVDPKAAIAAKPVTADPKAATAPAVAPAAATKPAADPKASQATAPVEQPKAVAAPKVAQPVKPGVVEGKAKDDPPKAARSTLVAAAKEAAKSAAASVAGKAPFASPKTDTEASKQKLGKPVPAAKPPVSKPQAQSGPPPKAVTAGKAAVPAKTAEAKAQPRPVGAGEKRKALMMGLLQRQASPRKRPALASGGAQAIVEIAEELKFQEKWYNENRKRWMPYLPPEAKMFKAVQPFSVKKAQELEDYLKGLGAFTS